MLIRWNEKVRWVQDFLLLPQGFKRFPSDLPRARWRNLVCAECLLMIKPMMVSFCFIEGWCWVIGVGLRTLAQFQGSEMSPGFLQSLLHSTTTQITISINVFTCFKCYTELNQFFLSKYMLRFYIFKFDLNVKHHFYFFW